MPTNRPKLRGPEMDALRAETQLERATREMFARWGEWRVAAPEDAPRAKAAIEQAELAYERAREEILAREATLIAPDYATLRDTLARLQRVLVRANADPRAVAGLLADRLARDLDGEPILGLSTARWRHVTPQRGVDVLELVEKEGRVVARLTHDRASPAPRWTGAAWNDEKGALDPIAAATPPPGRRAPSPQAQDE